MQYRIVIDTNVLLTALRSQRGASFRLLQMLADDGPLQTVLSTALMLEYEEILGRFRAEVALDEEAIEEVLNFLALIALQPTIYYRWRPALRDPDDEFLLDLAVAARCKFIVSFNGRDLEAAKTFGIEVITPAQLLRFLESL